MAITVIAITIFVFHRQNLVFEFYMKFTSGLIFIPNFAATES